MRKVLVIGSGGSGKSTFARRLGPLVGLEVIHLDVEHWGAGWAEPPKDEWRRKVGELIARDSWLMDGNYSGTLDVRLAACDTVIFLDLPRALCVWRIVKRVLTYRRGRRPDMAEGCDERFDFKFLLWVWNYQTRTRPRVLRMLEEHAHEKKVYHLRSRAEVEGFLAAAREGRLAEDEASV
ncbi:MAG TPA: DNA topology modulation protein [Pyrinomonadaceae bacterium]|nr:DNA topology modulation protein [Pyrinomonadaceae bacterium]